MTPDRGFFTEGCGRGQKRSPSAWIILGLACSFALGACSPSQGESAPDAPPGEEERAGPERTRGEDPGPLRIIDASGATLTFQEPPTRIVSLVPAATRMLALLGAQERLVGRTRYDTAASLTHLPSVGGGLGPDLETLVTLEPDLVIRFRGESDATTPNRLDDLGIPYLSLRLDRIAQVRAALLDLGSIVGARSEAETLVIRMNRVLEDIQECVQGRSRVRVAYVLGGRPPWVAGPGTFIHEILAIAGGENVFSDLTALYGPVSIEEFLTRDIDLILTTRKDELTLPGRDIPQVRVPHDMEIPGPGLADVARHLAEVLHPEVFR